VVKEGKVEGVRASEVEVQPLLKAGVLGVMHAGRNTEQKVERHLFEAEADREDGSLGVKQIVGDTKGRAYDDGDGLALNRAKASHIGDAEMLRPHGRGILKAGTDESKMLYRYNLGRIRTKVLCQ